MGGTGFYIQAVTGDIDFTVHGEDTTYRQMLEEKAKTEGAQVLHEMLLLWILHRGGDSCKQCKTGDPCTGILPADGKADFSA